MRPCLDGLRYDEVACVSFGVSVECTENFFKYMRITDKFFEYSGCFSPRKVRDRVFTSGWVQDRAFRRVWDKAEDCSVTGGEKRNQTAIERFVIRSHSFLFFPAHRHMIVPEEVSHKRNKSFLIPHAKKKTFLARNRVSELSIALSRIHGPQRSTETTGLTNLNAACKTDK